MGKRKKMKKGMPYKGFRMGTVPQQRINLKSLETCEVLTSLQHKIVQERLDGCTKEIKDEEGNVTETKLLTTIKHRQRLQAILDKPFNEAKVDHLGNDWEKPKEPTPEEIDKMNKDAVEYKNKKGKSRKDLEKENEGTSKNT